MSTHQNRMSPWKRLNFDLPVSSYTFTDCMVVLPSCLVLVFQRPCGPVFQMHASLLPRIRKSVRRRTALELPHWMTPPEAGASDHLNVIHSRAAGLAINVRKDRFA